MFYHHLGRCDALFYCFPCRSIKSFFIILKFNSSLSFLIFLTLLRFYSSLCSHYVSVSYAQPQLESFLQVTLLFYEKSVTDFFLELTSESVTVTGRTGLIPARFNILSRFLSCFLIITFSFLCLSIRSSSCFNFSFCSLFNLNNSSFSFSYLFLYVFFVYFVLT